MIDLKDYRENPEKYIKGAADKGHTIDWKLFDSLDSEVRGLKFAVDELNGKRNELSKSIQSLDKSGDEFKSVVTQVQAMKGELAEKEAAYEKAYTQFQAMLLSIPSPAFADVPVGTEHDNQVIKKIGEQASFDFEPKTHWELLEAKGYLDQDRAVKLSGSRFQIVRGGLAELQFALMQWASQKLIKKGFQLTLVPQLVREDAMRTTGFLPNDATNLYRVNPKLPHPNPLLEGKGDQIVSQDLPWEEDDLWLIGTAEVPLVGQHAGETFDVDQLPMRYCGFSSCYRREAGTYGKDTKGLIRLHQFEKVEMVSFVKPQDAEKEHELLFAIENEIFTELGLHYQQILIASGDLGSPAAKKYDIEAWFPGIGAYKEVTSTSNTTDYQTRRGNIKVKDGAEKYYAFSLNGTAVALGRALACIVETYQTAEGDIVVPEVLRPWMTKETI